MPLPLLLLLLCSASTALRAFYNAKALHSLDTWSPTINLARDPRWGRTAEVPSEDPYVLGQYALGYSDGAQKGPNPDVPMVGVTLKHWIGGLAVVGWVGSRWWEGCFRILRVDVSLFTCVAYLAHATPTTQKLTAQSVAFA